jgi:hypothetical protein
MFAALGVLLALTSNAGQASPVPPVDTTALAHTWCESLSKQLRSVNQERCNARQWKIDVSSDGGHAIPYLVWTDANFKPSADSKKVLILGAIHGDEIASVSIVFRWIDFLEKVKADSFLRKHQYLFIPLANPDGFFAKPRTRTNAAGVDLNRNFATREWDTKAMDFWKRKASSDPRRFPGAKASSERETQVIQKALEEFKPDMIVSVHAPYSLVDHDGPIEFPSMHSPLPVRALGAYPGSLGTYAGLERNIPVVTPELTSATQLPDIKVVEQLFLFIMKSKY